MATAQQEIFTYLPFAVKRFVANRTSKMITSAKEHKRDFRSRPATIFGLVETDKIADPEKILDEYLENEKRVEAYAKVCWEKIINDKTIKKLKETLVAKRVKLSLNLTEKNKKQVDEAKKELYQSLNVTFMQLARVHYPILRFPAKNIDPEQYDYTLLELNQKINKKEYLPFITGKYIADGSLWYYLDQQVRDIIKSKLVKNTKDKQR